MENRQVGVQSAQVRGLEDDAASAHREGQQHGAAVLGFKAFFIIQIRSLVQLMNGEQLGPMQVETRSSDSLGEGT